MNYLPPATSLITFLWSGGESILLVPMATRIIDVKLLISEVLHIPVPIDRQELSWEGQCLKDELTLQDYHIPPTAFLVIYKKIEVEIYLEFDGIRYVYLVFDGITVGELKAKLQAEQGVDIEHKVLWMVDNSYLDDHAQLLVAGVVEGTKLFLIEDKKPCIQLRELTSSTMDPNANLPPFVTTPIHVVCRGVVYPVLLLPITTRIIDLKQMIWQLFQVPILPERQELSCGQLLRDELTLQDYGIPPNAAIHVLVKFHVRICLSSQGPYYDYVVHEGTTMGDLKARLHADHGVVIENKVLRMNTTDHDDRTQLCAAGAVEGTELYLDDSRPRGRGRPRRGG